jgi:pimeloyl-ACP methyl ester carboxylesterase
MIVWGDRDGVIPVSHAYAAHQLIPGSRLEIVEGSGHFLPFEDPDRFLPILEDFMATTEPAMNTEQGFRDALASHLPGA